jgi:hypothetical protein
VAPEARIAGLVIIERERDLEMALDTDEALEVLMSNCEDAFGFPPYAQIEGFLQGMHGHNLKEAERASVWQAFGSVPATLIASSTMDWWKHLPAIMSSPLC